MSSKDVSDSNKEKEGTKDPLRFKAVIIGESNVGKTSLVQRLLTGNFSESLESTIGVLNSQMTFDTINGPVELCIWDTAGQEIFHSLVPLYSRSASVCILVCSIDVEKSLETINEWVATIEKNCNPIPPIILALNKIDLAEHDDQTLSNLKKRFPTTFQNDFACSALTGEGVNELFYSAALNACKANGLSVPEDPIKSNPEKKSCC